MTKLFSIKSLACAGAAAFALTLAAAPQASAADQEILKTAGNEPKIDYSKGILQVKLDTSKTNNPALTTDDGTSLYYGTGKTVDKIKKYTLIAASEESSGTLQFDISKLLGKDGWIKFSIDPDASVAARTCELEMKATPKLKAELGTVTISSKDYNDVAITVDGKKITKTLSTGADTTGTGYAYRYKIGAYGEWSTIQGGTAVSSVAMNDASIANILEAIKAAEINGSTLYVQVASATVSSSNCTLTSPWSKEAKIKIPGKAKAPKINVSTVLTKNFEWKMGDKVEYKLTVTKGSSAEKSVWTDGSTEKLGWEKILDNAATATNTASAKPTPAFITLNATGKLVQGDAIAVPVQIEVRTKENTTKKKPASNISVLKLAASPRSPRVEQIKVDYADGKTASGVAITPVESGIQGLIDENTAITGNKYVAQYSLDDTGKKWKVFTKETVIAYDKLNSGKLYLRLVAEDKKSTLLPSAVTTITVPKWASTDKDKPSTKTTTTAADYIVGEGYEVSSNKWETKTSFNASAKKDYNDVAKASWQTKS